MYQDIIEIINFIKETKKNIDINKEILIIIIKEDDRNEIGFISYENNKKELILSLLQTGIYNSKIISLRYNEYDIYGKLIKKDIPEIIIKTEIWENLLYYINKISNYGDDDKEKRIEKSYNCSILSDIVNYKDIDSFINTVNNFNIKDCCDNKDGFAIKINLKDLKTI